MTNVFKQILKKNQNLFSAFEQVAEHFPKRIALIGNGGRGKSYTYQDVKTLAGKIAKVLSSDSSSKGSEIGLLSENRPEWGIAYLAIIASGKTVIPIDANLKENEINFIIDHSNLKALFVSKKYEQMLSGKKNLRLFSFEEDSSNYWKDHCDTGNSQIKSDTNNIAILIYTSGTTGAPKAVELTHQNLLSNLYGINAAFDFNQNDIFLSVLPLHHTFEATCGFLTPLMSGATIVYARSLKSKEIMEDIAFNNITLMCGVPLLFEKMYHSICRGIKSSPIYQRTLFKILFIVISISWYFGIKSGKKLFRCFRQKTGLGSIRMFVSGGAAIPSQVSRFFNFIGFDFYQGYGMTECSPVITVNFPGKIKFGSVGFPIKDVEVKIHNSNNDNIGEIIVKGPNVTPGYRNNSDETAKLIKDGWLYTGDLGQIKNGQLWITGRKKNLIVSAAGKNIYPEQLEEKLLESNYILESVVFGRQKKNRQGEEIFAIIVPDMERIRAEFNIHSSNPDSDAIYKIIKNDIGKINLQIADYKRINNFEIQFAELEKTSTKKIKRFLYK